MSSRVVLVMVILASPFMYGKLETVMLAVVTVILAALLSWKNVIDCHAG
jgi:hypothetical protein